MFRGKKYQESAKQIDKNVQYDPADGLALICKTASAKFDETVELHVKLGVDSMLHSFLIRTGAGGVLVMKLKERSA